MHAKTAPYNPEFRRLVAHNAQEEVDPSKRKFDMVKEKKLRHPSANTIQISYEPNEHVFARYTYSRYADHVPVFKKKSETVDWSNDWHTTISGSIVTGFEPGTINRYEAGIRQKNYAIIAGVQSDHLSGLPFAFDSHQYAPFNQSVHDSQRIGLSFAAKLSPKITARVGYIEGKSHWSNGMALQVTNVVGHAPSRIAPYSPDSQTVMSPETEPDKFICKELNQDGTCKHYYTPEEIDDQIRELNGKLKHKLLEAKWYFESDVSFDKIAITISSGVTLEEEAKQLGVFANTIRTGSCGVGQQNTLACKEGAEQVIEKAKTLYERRAKFTKAVFELNEIKKEIDHLHEVLELSKATLRKEGKQAILDSAVMVKDAAQQAFDETYDLEIRAARVENYLRAEANSMVCHLYESDGTINRINERLIEDLVLAKSTVCSEAPSGFNQSIDTTANIVKHDDMMICREFGNTSDPDRSKWTCNSYIGLEEAAIIVDGNKAIGHNSNSYLDQSNSYTLNRMVSQNSLNDAASSAYYQKEKFLEIYNEYLSSKSSAIDVYMEKPQEFATMLWVELHDWANSHVLSELSTCEKSEFKKLKDLHHQVELIFQQVKILIPDITTTTIDNRNYYNRIQVVANHMKRRIDEAQPYITLLESVLSYGIDLANYVGCDIDPEEEIAWRTGYRMLDIANELGLDFVCRADSLIELKTKARKARDAAEKESKDTNLIPGEVTQDTRNAKSRTENALVFCQQDPKSTTCKNAAIDAWHYLYIAFIYRNDLAFQHQKVQLANTTLIDLVLSAHIEASQADRGVTYDIAQISAIEGYKEEVSNDDKTGFYDRVDQYLKNANSTFDATILDASSPQLVGCYLPQTFEKNTGALFNRAKAEQLAQAIPNLDLTCRLITNGSDQSTSQRASMDSAVSFVRIRPGNHNGGADTHTSPNNPAHPLHKIHQAYEAASDAWDSSKASDAEADRQEQAAYDADQKADKSQNAEDRKEADTKIVAALKARLQAKAQESDAKAKENAYIIAYRTLNGADPEPLDQHLSTPKYTQDDFNPPLDDSGPKRPKPDEQSSAIRPPIHHSNHSSTDANPDEVNLSFNPNAPEDFNKKYAKKVQADRFDTSLQTQAPLNDNETQRRFLSDFKKYLSPYSRTRRTEQEKKAVELDFLAKNISDLTEGIEQANKAGNRNKAERLAKARAGFEQQRQQLLQKQLPSISDSTDDPSQIKQEAKVQGLGSGLLGGQPPKRTEPPPPKHKKEERAFKEEEYDSSSPPKVATGNPLKSPPSSQESPQILTPSTPIAPPMAPVNVSGFEEAKEFLESPKPTKEAVPNTARGGLTQVSKRDHGHKPSQLRIKDTLQISKHSPDDMPSPVGDSDHSFQESVSEIGSDKGIFGHREPPSSTLPRRLGDDDSSPKTPTGQPEAVPPPPKPKTPPREEAKDSPPNRQFPPNKAAFAQSREEQTDQLQAKRAELLRKRDVAIQALARSNPNILELDRRLTHAKKNLEQLKTFAKYSQVDLANQDKIAEAAKELATLQGQLGVAFFFSGDQPAIQELSSASIALDEINQRISLLNAETLYLRVTIDQRAKEYKALSDEQKALDEALYKKNPTIRHLLHDLQSDQRALKRIEEGVAEALQDGTKEEVTERLKKHHTRLIELIDTNAFTDTELADQIARYTELTNDLYPIEKNLAALTARLNYLNQQPVILRRPDEGAPQERSLAIKRQVPKQPVAEAARTSPESVQEEIMSDLQQTLKTFQEKRIVSLKDKKRKELEDLQQVLAGVRDPDHRKQIDQQIQALAKNLDIFALEDSSYLSQAAVLEISPSLPFSPSTPESQERGISLQEEITRLTGEIEEGTFSSQQVQAMTLYNEIAEELQEHFKKAAQEVKEVSAEYQAHIETIKEINASQESLVQKYAFHKPLTSSHVASAESDKRVQSFVLDSSSPLKPDLENLQGKMETLKQITHTLQEQVFDFTGSDRIHTDEQLMISPASSTSSRYSDRSPIKPRALNFIDELKSEVFNTPKNERQKAIQRRLVSSQEPKILDEVYQLFKGNKRRLSQRYYSRSSLSKRRQEWSTPTVSSFDTKSDVVLSEESPLNLLEPFVSLTQDFGVQAELASLEKAQQEINEQAVKLAQEKESLENDYAKQKKELKERISNVQLSISKSTQNLEEALRQYTKDFDAAKRWKKVQFDIEKEKAFKEIKNSQKKEKHFRKLSQAAIQNRTEDITNLLHKRAPSLFDQEIVIGEDSVSAQQIVTEEDLIRAQHQRQRAVKFDKALVRELQEEANRLHDEWDAKDLQYNKELAIIQKQFDKEMTDFINHHTQAKAVLDAQIVQSQTELRALDYHVTQKLDFLTKEMAEYTKVLNEIEKEITSFKERRIQEVTQHIQAYSSGSDNLITHIEPLLPTLSRMSGEDSPKDEPISQHSLSAQEGPHPLPPPKEIADNPFQVVESPQQSLGSPSSFYQTDIALLARALQEAQVSANQAIKEAQIARVQANQKMQAAEAMQVLVDQTMKGAQSIGDQKMQEIVSKKMQARANRKMQEAQEEQARANQKMQEAQIAQSIADEIMRIAKEAQARVILSTQEAKEALAKAEQVTQEAKEAQVRVNRAIQEARVAGEALALAQEKGDPEIQIAQAKANEAMQAAQTITHQEIQAIVGLKIQAEKTKTYVADIENSITNPQDAFQARVQQLNEQIIASERELITENQSKLALQKQLTLMEKIAQLKSVPDAQAALLSKDKQLIDLETNLLDIELNLTIARTQRRALTNQQDAPLLPEAHQVMEKIFAEFAKPSQPKKELDSPRLDTTDTQRIVVATQSEVPESFNRPISEDLSSIAYDRQSPQRTDLRQELGQTIPVLAEQPLLLARLEESAHVESVNSDAQIRDLEVRLGMPDTQRRALAIQQSESLSPQNTNTPWWKKGSTWLIVGAVAAIGIFIAWLLRDGKEEEPVVETSPEDEKPEEEGSSESTESSDAGANTDDPATDPAPSDPDPSKPLTPPIFVKYQPKPQKNITNWLLHQAWHNDEDEDNMPPETVTLTPNQPVDVFEQDAEHSLYDLAAQDSKYKQLTIGIDYNISRNIKLNFSLGYLGTQSCYYFTNDAHGNPRASINTPLTYKRVAGIDLMIRF